MFKKWLLSLTGLLVFCLVAGLAAACAPAPPRDVAFTGGAHLSLLTQSWPLLRPVHHTP